ncbi:acyl-CoA dehydrogenase family protein [Aquihabitans sp. McL0605]|uniref:acyl-CoA dehydrogenase family protein n=1 Tax=Aquihabitans sp. McL0605 TaxID=3415671 RepID=UPI003CEE51D7
MAGVLQSGSHEALPAPDPGWRSGWPALAALGATALSVPEALGGSGVQPEVAAATAAELGAALHGSPFAGLLACASALAAAAPADARAADALAAIVAGDRIGAYGRLDASSSTARNVDGAPAADLLVLHDPATGDLVLIDDRGAWTEREDLAPFDLSRSSADVTIEPGRGHRLAADPTAEHLFHLLLAADALGGTERVLARTVAYAGDRQAFGRPIGGFQAVQHRLADHAVRTRGISLLVREAARSIARGAPDIPRRVALAEAGASSGAGHILHDLLQLTGAIGFTWEYGLHAFQRRVHQDARLAANPRRARFELASIEGWTGGR